MAKNSKPILSVLIEEEKRTKFADLARRHSLSMGYLVNKAIDRMLETDSIDIYGESTPTSAGNYVDSSVGGMNRTDIEELIKSSIVSTDIERLVKSYVDSHNSSLVSVDDVKQLITASANELLELIPSDIPTLETIKAEINLSIAPHADRLAELETYTQSQLAAVRDEIKKAISNRSVTTEAVATVPDPVSPTGDGVEYLSFHQLANELGYVLPVELKDKPPQVRATALIAYAATLGQSYGWNGKKQKLYRTEV
jgi:hypothetical protein